MAGLYLAVSVAFAGQVEGHSIHDLFYKVALQEASRRMTLEASTALGPCTMDYEAGWADLRVAQEMLADCPTLAGYQIEEVDGYVHLYPNVPADRVLDRLVTLTPGVRPLRDVRHELGTQLVAATEPEEVPFLGVVIGGVVNPQHWENLNVEVPSGTHSARNLLRQLRPMAANPWWESSGADVDYQARLIWTLRETARGQSVILQVRDVTEYPPPPDSDRWVMPEETRTRAELYQLAIDELEAEHWGDQDQTRLDHIEAIKRKMAEEASSP